MVNSKYFFITQTLGNDFPNGIFWHRDIVVRLCNFVLKVAWMKREARNPGASELRPATSFQLSGRDRGFLSSRSQRGKILLFEFH